MSKVPDEKYAKTKEQGHQMLKFNRSTTHIYDILRLLFVTKKYFKTL